MATDEHSETGLQYDEQENWPEFFNAHFEGHLSGYLGIRIVEAEPERLLGRLHAHESICNRNGRLNGGAVMAFADTLGAMATRLNLPAGAASTTIESKTNFISSAAPGETVLGETTPLHRGRSTQVWQTKITRETDGKLLAYVVQTQMVLPPRG